MDDEMKLQMLTLQRESVKGQVNAFQLFLNNCTKHTDLFQLPIRLQRLNSLFEKFDPLCDELDLLNPSEDSKAMRFSILFYYFRRQLERL